MELVLCPLFSIKCNSKSSTSLKSEKQTLLSIDRPTQEQKPAGNMEAGHHAQQIPPRCLYYIQVLFVLPAVNVYVLPTKSLAEHVPSECVECMTLEGCLDHSEGLKMIIRWSSKKRHRYTPIRASNFSFPSKAVRPMLVCT